MAASTTITENAHGSVKKITWAWTSAADGSVSGATTQAYSGAVLSLLTIPDGSAAPTASYDITVTDADSHDVLFGAGADRHTSNTEYVTSALGFVAGSKLTLNVTNAGDTKEGVVVLWIR